MAKIDTGHGRVIKSVADVHYFDNHDNLVAIGTALSSSALSSEVSETVVSGGYLNPEILDFKYGRTLSLTATSVTFKPEYLEMNLGSKFTDVATEKYAYGEAHTVDASGNIELKHLPTSGNITVSQGDKVLSNDLNTGVTTIVVGAAYAGQKVSVSYFYGKNTVGEETSTISFNTDKEPMILKAVLTFHYQETATSNEGLYQIVIPRLKLSGQISLDLSADGTSTLEVGGKALASIEDDGSSVLATWTTIPLVSATEELESIVIQPSNFVFENVGDTRQLTAIGVYNTGRKEVLTTGITYTSDDTAVATVSATGLVTAVATGLAIILAEDANGISGKLITEVE